MNRVLIAQSYKPGLKLKGDSNCDDVVHMKKALAALGRQTKINCGEGGTTLRFLAFRVSRHQGDFFLKGSPRLLSRPQKEIQGILKQLGVEVEFEAKGLRIISRGWKEPRRPIKVKAKESSQFLSALFLNAWELNFDLKIEVVGKVTSLGYFEMTLRLLKDLGMKYSRRGNIYNIRAGQKVTVKKYTVESDLSSLFSVAAFAAVSGKAHFLDFPQKSRQPDRAFVDIFKRMGVSCTQRRSILVVRAGRELKSVKVNLQNSPDLFPVLATLCAFAKGRSVLYGAPQLSLKESDRIEKTRELLEGCGIECRPRKDGMEIHGIGGLPGALSFRFNPDKDHRLAMAAALLKFYGQKLKIKEPDVVRKSFPDFWRCVGVKP